MRPTQTNLKASSKRPLVALLESSPCGELASALQDQGGVGLVVPTVSAALYGELEEVRGLLDDLASGRFEVVIFMSGTSVWSLVELAEELGRRGELISALRRVTTACRGPKAVAVLRGYGVLATLGAGEPMTSTRLIHVLGELHLARQRVLRFNGEANDAIAEKLQAKSANVREVSLLQRRSRGQTQVAEDLVRSIIRRGVDALIVTCDIQFRHLYQIARRADLARAFVQALRKDVLVATVGVTCQDIIEAHGVRPHVMPGHPKILVMALLRFLDKREHVAPVAALHASN